jgi:hypothetical protein
MAESFALPRMTDLSILDQDCKDPLGLSGAVEGRLGRFSHPHADSGPYLQNPLALTWARLLQAALSVKLQLGM